MIIGAPRSGTNMLRDVLTQFPGVATWPCDEINYIWRHGNLRYPSDEFTPDMARPRVRRYIRRQFDWVARRYGAEFVVEKTCANSLRVPFVDAVVPEARYVFIRRDGLDAVGSAMKRWKAPLDIPYLARKARFVPLTDLPYYGGRYLWNRFYRLFSREERLAFWGPQLAGMEELLAEHPLDEVCALQWRRCVASAAAAFAAMPAEKWLEVAYEDFVTAPERELGRVLDFLGIEAGAAERQEAVAGVQAGSIGKGREALDGDAVRRLERLVGDALGLSEGACTK
ncbi:sulfotransferase family protein [Thiohalorhabdus sp.]|uniref:sulfotransferase family protein n=1 Tax=Thiohalorhabdus sp. TaxID=3094134 RepID=UPI002FC2BBB1